MTLSVDVAQSLGSFSLEAKFESRGRLTALFGASGSGKTSMVNLIAGLTRPSRGRIAIDGKPLVDTEKRIFLPAHKRRIGYVFQDARLFPHLTVGQNLNYGRWFTPGAERYADQAGVIEMLGIGHLLDRRPGALSGGEKQRVALGRALIASPRLILMDEPLAALDEARKAEIMPYIERLRDESRIPIVYVSHSMAEVARLATDVVMMSGGRVAAAGTAAEILLRHDLLPPEHRDEAGALLSLTVVEQDEHYRLTVLRSAGGLWRLPRVEAEPGAILRARVRARDVMISTGPIEGASALNMLEATIRSIEAGEGPDAILKLDCGGEVLLARITRKSVDGLGLAVGRTVQAVIKSVTFEAQGGAHRRPVDSLAAPQ